VTTIYNRLMVTFVALLGFYGAPAEAFSATTDNLDKIKQLLNLSLQELMDVEVKAADKVSERIGEIPASVILITRQDIETYGYTTLDELLEHVSGMYKIDTYNNQGESYGVRGFWNTQLNKNVIILVNGVSQLSDMDSSYALTYLVPIEAIDRIEIIRGPLSVIYGSGAFFGVINIITNQTDAKEKYPHYRISAGVGTEQTHQTFARIQHRYQQGQFTLNASTYDTDGLDHPYNDMASQLLPPAIGKSTEGKLGTQRKQVNLSASYHDVSLEVTHSDVDKQFGYALPTVGRGHLSAAGVTRLQLGYQTHLTDHFSIEAKLGYSDLETESYLDTEVLKPGSGGSQHIHAQAHHVEIDTSWQLNDQLDLVSGIQYRHASQVLNTADVPMVKNASQRVELMPGESLVNWGAFAQLNYQYSKKWKWVGGIRLQQTFDYEVLSERPNMPQQIRSIDSTSIRMIPRFAAIYTPNPSHIFKLLYGHAENNPSFLQLFLFNDSDKELEPEEIQTLELDYLTYLSPRYLLSINLFKNKLQGLLTRKLEIMPGNTLRASINNAGQWKTQGAEVTLQAQPTEAWQLELGATYQTTQDLDNSDIAVAYSPHLLGQLKLAYQVNSKTQLSLTGYYVSEMESYFDPTKKNATGNLGARIGEAGGNYFILGANIHLQDWWIKGTFANLRISNLFDQAIRYPTTLENTWANKGLVGHGRTLMFNIGYQFH